MNRADFWCRVLGWLQVAGAAAVGGWLQRSDVQDAEDERRLLITDALTLQVAVIGARLLDWPAVPLPVTG